MRLVIAGCLVAGCGFAPSPSTSGLPPDPNSPDADPLVPRTCHSSDPDVRLCLDFEDLALAPVIADNSLGRHDASATAVNAMPRSNQQAALVTTGSSITVPETADLDIAQNLTIEMWLRPAVLGTQPSPLTNTGQYALGIDNDQVVCTFGTHNLTSDGQLVVNKWTHVACTYDGASIRVYFDGAVDSCQTAAGTIANTNTAGTVIASGYAGGIDDVHVYARTLAPLEVQALAGVTTNKTGCP